MVQTPVDMTQYADAGRLRGDAAPLAAAALGFDPGKVSSTGAGEGDEAQPGSKAAQAAPSTTPASTTSRWQPFIRVDSRR